MLSRARKRYSDDDRLRVICVYFNPNNYERRLANFHRFYEPFALGGVEILVVEGHYHDSSRLPDDLGATIVPVACRDTLWQKERLLNLALEHLPSSCPFVAWVDCDMIFDDDDWIPRTAAALEREHAFVQPFEAAIQLPDLESSQAELRWHPGFGARIACDPSVALERFQVHGHTGFAWAARADLVNANGFYDRCITGSSDHLMAHAMTATPEAPCVSSALGAGSAAYSDYLRWSHSWARRREGKVGHIPGVAFHLWHGDPDNRQYYSHNQGLQELGFDPAADLELDDAGCWRFHPERSDLVHWAKNFFSGRREDG